MRVPFNKPYTTNTTYIRNDRFTCTSCHQAEIPTENLLSESYRKKFLSDPNRTATTGGGIYYHNDRKLDVFALSSSNSGTGTCLPYPMQPFVACAELGTDERGTQYKANITCTKVVKQLDLTDSRDLPQGAQAHFKKAVGYGSMYTAVCNVLKKTTCTSSGGGGGACKVTKTVACDKICKPLTKYSFGPEEKYGGCWRDLCEGEHGTMACKRVTMLA